MLQPPRDTGKVQEAEEKVCFANQDGRHSRMLQQEMNGKVAEILVSLYNSSWPLKEVIRTDVHKMCQHAGEEAFHEQAQPDAHS